jgi:hypothetical protein
MVEEGIFSVLKTVEDREGNTGVHEELPSGPYPSLLRTTDTVRRGSWDTKVRTFETVVYCSVFICMLANGFLNRQMNILYLIPQRYINMVM